MNDSYRVLLVEDDVADAELIRIELERAGYDITWQRVETEPALRATLANAEWDLVISDFSMPGFDGLQAFQVFKETNSDIPFIFVSGQLGEERAITAMRAGDYFLKGELGKLNAAVSRELGEVKSRASRRHAYALVTQERRRLAVAVEASGAGVFEHHVPSRPSVYASERWCEILGIKQSGLPPNDEVKDWVVNRIHPDDQDLANSEYAEFLSGQAERFALELRIRHERGHWVHVAVSAKALERDCERRARHVVGVMMDLTEQRKLEDQLRQAQKMEAVGRLAGGVAHDFNNLLTVILGFGELVLGRLNKEDSIHGEMEQVLFAAQKAANLTEQLLAFSRRKPVCPRTVNLSELVWEMEKMLARLVGEDVQVQPKLTTDLWNVRVDPGSLEQVVVNLCVNARDAMPDGGRLVIETRNIQLACDITAGDVALALAPPGQYVQLSISDEGSGMDLETQQKIFEPFFTTKDVGKGTGLGLSTCYGIIKQAAGYVSVESNVGYGTTFTITLPRTRGTSEHTALVPRRTEGRGSETLLLVEDDAQVRELALRILSRLGYTVIDASNGEECFERCKYGARQIDLLLTDIQMPGMGGKELVARMRVFFPGLRVLFMSGYASDLVMERGVCGVDGHILGKPFTPGTLSQRVREVLDEAALPLC